jgi:hypothetical protein
MRVVLYCEKVRRLGCRASSFGLIVPIQTKKMNYIKLALIKGMNIDVCSGEGLNGRGKTEAENEKEQVRQN